MIWLLLTLVVLAVSMTVVAETIKNGKDNVIRRTGKELAESQVFQLVATKLPGLVVKKMEAMVSSAQSAVARVFGKIVERVLLGIVVVLAGIVVFVLVGLFLQFVFWLLVFLVGLFVG
jgi:hypothetical protein